MKVNLIFPNPKDCIDFRSVNSLCSTVLKYLLNGGATNYTPPLSLLMLAAVTPPDVEVNITDERVQKIDFDESVDLVGITVVTRSAPRAYEIAAEYRRRGIKVVLGGIHPSALPAESVLHADALVVGEGESVWPQLLDDHRKGKMRRIYKGMPQLDLDSLPLPRREIIPQPEMYATLKVLSATRGCPNTCSFCSAGIGLLKKHRKRSVHRVIAELESLPGRVAIFVDDNLGWDLPYTKELMRAMTPLGIRWTGSVSANALEDLEFVELAARSGCTILSIGLESLSPQVISRIRKSNTNDPSRYPALIARLHKVGVAVQGNFIVGFDEDSKDIFAVLEDFFNNICIEIPWVSPLIPYPGSVLYRQYEKEGRLLHKNWGHYDSGGGQCVFLPKQMTPQELMEGYLDLLTGVYSARSIARRLVGAGTWSTAGVLATVHINLEYQRSIPLRRARVEQYKKTSAGED